MWPRPFSGIGGRGSRAGGSHATSNTSAIIGTRDALVKPSAPLEGGTTHADSLVSNS